MSADGAAGLDTPRSRAELVLFVAGVAACWRLALANWLLGLALLLWLGRRAAGRRSCPLLLPIGAYAFATICSVAASVEPRVSWKAISELLMFVLVPLGMALVRTPRAAEGLLDTFVLSGSVLASWGVVQFALGWNDLSKRIQGPLSHYMTFSGVVLLAALVAWARLGLGPGSRTERALAALGAILGAGVLALAVTPGLSDVTRWGARALVLLGLIGGIGAAVAKRAHRRTAFIGLAVAVTTAALALSFTRNAWIGLLAGGLIVLIASTPKAILVVAPAALLSLWLLPEAIRARIQGTFDPAETSNYDRLCMLEAGLAIVSDHPLLGLGPDTIRLRYPLYRRKDAPRFTVPHLHNNLIHIAAERGLPAAAAYLALLAVFARGAIAGLRAATSRSDKALVVACLAAIVGISVAGLFEANFRDTEVLIPTLALMTLPFAAGRAGGAWGGREARAGERGA